MIISFPDGAACEGAGGEKGRTQGLRKWDERRNPEIVAGKEKIRWKWDEIELTLLCECAFFFPYSYINDKSLERDQINGRNVTKGISYQVQMNVYARIVRFLCFYDHRPKR